MIVQVHMINNLFSEKKWLHHKIHFFKILFYYNKLKKDNTFYEISYDECLC